MHQNDGYIVQEWDGYERRGIDGITLQLMAEVRDVMEKHEEGEKEKFEEIKELIKDNKESSESRHTDLGNRFDAMQQSTLALLMQNNQTTSEIHKLFKTAFPDGNAEAHRHAHEMMMEKDKTEKEFFLKLKGDAIRWVLFAVAGWSGVVLWTAFVKGPG